jgi:phage tail sheath protein FI
MPITPTYPGVYIEEVPSGVRTITPVATAITAFVGSAPRGLADEPVRVQSFGEFERKFGGLQPLHSMSYAVQQYFRNGGSDALIVRVTAAAAVAAVVDANGLPLRAASRGAWGNEVRVRVDLNARVEPSGEQLFNLFAYDRTSRSLESFRNLSTDRTHRRFVGDVLDEESEIVRLQADVTLSGTPSAHADPQRGTEWFQDANAGGAFAQASGGDDDGDVVDADIRGSRDAKTGIYALEKTDLFNLLCLPPLDRAGDTETDTYSEALVYCTERRAMLLFDPPSSWSRIDQAQNGVDTLRNGLGGEDRTKNAAIYFPRIRVADPLKENRLDTFVPCGAVAGVFARTDVSRGVWKAPAGIEAGLAGVQEFTVPMTDPENGRLNPLGVNCLRNFRAYGNVVWGSRTLAGTDALGSEHKYVPVRRLTLFLEESLYRGTQWVVFEPNDEPLWAQIRLNVGAFMNDMFRQGAFQGRTPREAYFVNCGADTTTQNDINRGIVNIEVGFAPLKPAEFVIIKIQQIAGKIET